MAAEQGGAVSSKEQNYKEMPSKITRGTAKAACLNTTWPPPFGLEEEFHCELHKTWIGSWIGAGHHAKICVVTRAACRIRWCKLLTIQ